MNKGWAARSSLEEAARLKPYEYWLSKNSYYHRELARLYRSIIVPESRVLHVGCKSGFLLKAVQAVPGVGIDDDEQTVQAAREQYPDMTFYAGGFEKLADHPPFDYIVLSSVIMEADDIQALLEKLHPWCHERTRLVVDFYSHTWEPLLWLTQKLGMRRPTKLKNWVSYHDVTSFLQLANFEPISQGYHTLMPAYIPLLSWLCNTLLIHVPLLRCLSLNKWMVVRPTLKKSYDKKPTVSVVVPCRNERGNVEAAVQRCPDMGGGVELIFAEGNSRDGTLDEIKRVAAAYPDKNIKYVVQDGVGKGDAVRKGFNCATGDVLMILDADLTTPPEELPKFYDALVSGKGDFINGSRLVYGMESEAMRFLNLLANHFFGRLFSWVLEQSVKDTLCGTKVLFKEDYLKIVKHRSHFGDFDPFGDFDLLFGAAWQNMKIVDLPVHYKNRTYGTTQIRRFYHGFILLQMSLIGLKKLKLRLR